MPAYKSVSIVHDGVRHNASWHIDKDTVHVSSAYGSRSAPVTQEGAADTAARLLTDIIDTRPG